MGHTIKNIGLDLRSSVAKFVESIACVTSKGSVLHRCDNIDKHIILQNKTQKQIQHS